MSAHARSLFQISIYNPNIPKIPKIPQNGINAYSADAWHLSPESPQYPQNYPGGGGNLFHPLPGAACGRGIRGRAARLSSTKKAARKERPVGTGWRWCLATGEVEAIDHQTDDESAENSPDHSNILLGEDNRGQKASDSPP